MKISYLTLVLLFILVGCQFQKPDYLTTISPIELNEIMKKEDIFLVDVHIPQQRHIMGTDAFIPFNEVEKHLDKLPQDKNMPIYLYCMGGPMGNAAAKKLHELGYTNLKNLEGGAEAWKKASFAFQ